MSTVNLGWCGSCWPRPARLLLLASLASFAGCGDEGAGEDASLPDGGDAHVSQDAADASDTGVPDSAVLDGTVDAAPNPNVIELPPSGQTQVDGFTNGGFIATYADARGTLGADIYYYDVLARQEVQVTNREATQDAPDTDGQVIMFGDFQFGDVPNGHYQAELYSYDILSAVEARLTNEVSMKVQPVFNSGYILYRSSVGCGEYYITNLMLWDRSTGEATVVSDCGQSPETQSIGDFYAAWSARPYPGHNKDIYVRDLAAGYTFRIDSTDAGSQYFPTTDSDHVVWQDDRDGQREIYMYTISTGVEECLTPDPWQQGWPFLRDGIVAWCDFRYSQQVGYNDPCDVYVYEIATGVGRRVTTESRKWRPRYVDSGWMLYAKRVTGMQYKLFMHDLVSDGILSPDGHVIP